MLLLFQGYADGQPQSAIATLDSNGISRISNRPLGLSSGELSHDGKLIAFDNCQHETRGIYVARVDVDSSPDDWRLVTPIVVPTEHTVCSWPRWSPDDRKISYKHPVDHLLHIVSVDGTGDTPLKNAAASTWHTWSPQGDRIIFDRGGGGHRLLFSVNMAGEVQPVTSADDFGKCESWAPDWSPDGKHVVFTSCDGKLYTISPEGKDLRPIATRPYRAYSPRWSVDGGWILFQSSSGTQLLCVRSDGEFLSIIGDLPFRGGPISVGPLH
jgi:Tol biopolymer transport system component